MELEPAPVGVLEADTTPAFRRALKIPLISGIDADGAVDAEGTGATGGRKRDISIASC